MTPEEKAKYLYLKMKRQQQGPGIEAAPENAKRSAIICCDEIIDTFVSSFNPDRQYWEKVKQYIQSI